MSQLEEIDRLKRLIAQLLMLARAESGDIALARVNVDLAGLVAALVDQLEPVAEAKGVDLRFEPGDSVVLVGDEDWLKRLVLNLVDNAIKFTPGGSDVLVRVRVDGDRAVLQVSDTGEGIAADLLPRIFDPFVRADSSRSHHVEGAGLGLSLVKWIVDRHRGRIDVQSIPSQGSTFAVYLPLH